jgi:hypothetical protein
MKRFTYFVLAVTAMAVMLTSCRPDNVGPKDDRGGSGIAGAAGDIHPTLDTICKASDYVYFRSMDGSWEVNKCGWENGDSAPSPCPPGQEPWGSLYLYNGYLTPQNGPVSHWLDVSFSLAYGWYVDNTQWEFFIADSLLIDPNTNLPATVNVDWDTRSFLNDARSEWKVQVLVSSLPQPCFDLGARMSISTIDVNGVPSEAFRTTVWAVNSQWNNPNSDLQSNNQFAIRYCPFGCLENQCATATNTVCKKVYTGLTCNSTLGTTVLEADPTGITNPVYNWSNGTHGQSITVSPTSNTTYTVTIVEGSCNKRITTFNVSAINLACQAPDGRADFCPSNLDCRYGQSFNIRNYVRMKNGQPVDWNELVFTYTAVGANKPTVPANWNLAAFNAGQNVTITSADAVTGSGNMGRGEYRIFVYRNGQTTYDDFMTIRVHPTRTSNVATAVCTTGACGYIPGVRICNVPPGQPLNGTSLCVPYNELSPFNIAGLCGSAGGPTDNYLGICGQDPCSGN